MMGNEPPQIETHRLALKLPDHYWLDDLRTIHGDSDFQQFMGLPGWVSSAEHVCSLIDDLRKEWGENGRGLLMMIEKASNRAVGIVGTQASPLWSGAWEVVVATHPEFRRRGFAREALRAIVGHEFSKGLDALYGRVHPDNAASVAIMLSLGFERRQDRVIIDWGPKADRVYVLNNPEYNA